MNCLVLNVAVALVLVTSGHQIVFGGAQKTSLAQQAYDAAQAVVTESKTVLDFVRNLSMNPTTKAFETCVGNFDVVNNRASQAAEYLRDLSGNMYKASIASGYLVNAQWNAKQCVKELNDIPEGKNLIPLIQSQFDSLAKTIDNAINLANQLVNQRGT